MTTAVAEGLKVADQVWVATAELHRERPHEADFSIEEIKDRAAAMEPEESLRPGVYVHIVQHCVAGRAPNRGRYRMLTETVSGRRRLFRDGDPYHAAREGGKITPEPDALPETYTSLLRWYRDWIATSKEDLIKNDPLLALRGSGTDIWADEHTDEYIRRMREGWA